MSDIDWTDEPEYVKRCVTHHNACDCLEWQTKQRIAKLEAKNETLRQYVRHKPSCAANRETWQNLTHGDCNCGLDALLKGSE